MKIISLTACLILVSTAAAKNYQLLASQEDGQAQRQLPDLTSEVAFRSRFLSDFDAMIEETEAVRWKGQNKSMAPSNEDGDLAVCMSRLEDINPLMQSIMSQIPAKINVPGIHDLAHTLLEHVGSATDLLLHQLGINLGPIFGVLHAVQVALSVVEVVLTVISYVHPHVTHFIGPVHHIKAIIDSILSCNSASANSVERIDQMMSFEVESCAVLADFYRYTVDAASLNSPLRSSDGHSEDLTVELKRALEGAQALVELSKLSIATSNDDLLKVRPVFTTKTLRLFQQEIDRVSQTEAQREYANLSLFSIIASSNALEACLRIAADPVGAVDDLNKEQVAADHEDKGKDDVNGDHRDEDDEKVGDGTSAKDGLQANEESEQQNQKQEQAPQQLSPQDQASQSPQVPQVQSQPEK
ncbi:hypothetical protein DFQ27_009745 [Actinomortierella ambigua]|uniref:Uncharacterized protein n=1 Tax=Actinomortierella ambigua TaxID=1343610 RepID=A0A9P6QF14_9FUNG|nr:hypothetical protein DFQ27_009745 [Actinomortierella ambigua]